MGQKNIDDHTCSIARTLTILGERWTLLILREALAGKTRYADFNANSALTRHAGGPPVHSGRLRHHDPRVYQEPGQPAGRPITRPHRSRTPHRRWRTVGPG